MKFSVVIIIAILATTGVNGLEPIKAVKAVETLYGCVCKANFSVMDVFGIFIDAGTTHVNEKLVSVCKCVMVEKKFGPGVNAAAIKALIPKSWDQKIAGDEVDKCVTNAANNTCQFLMCMGTSKTIVNMLL